MKRFIKIDFLHLIMLFLCLGMANCAGMHQTSVTDNSNEQDETSSESPTSDDETPSQDVDPTAGRFQVIGGNIYHDASPIDLFGVNWFGFETSSYVVHGLWDVGYKFLISRILDMGFNAVRLPFCPTPRRLHPAPLVL